MIIDAHAHVLAPQAFYGYRASLEAAGGRHRGSPNLSSDEIADAAAANVAIMDGVGTDLQLISPRPYQQMHSAKPSSIVHWWIAANNDLIAEVVSRHPTRFAGVAGLPVCAGEPVTGALSELDRAVEDLGFVGVSLNPDPYEGLGPSPTLDDSYWFPLFERLVHYGVPALIHSAGCRSGRESYSEHFVTEESIAILSLIRGRVLDRYPDLQIVIAHGGGSVPYQIGRWQAEALHPGLGGDPEGERFEVALRRLWFDTVLHNPLSLELLLKVVGPDRCLFGTEKPGSGSAVNPATGSMFDDIKPVIDSLPFLGQDDRSKIFEGNALCVFPRLVARLADAVV